MIPRGEGLCNVFVVACFSLLLTGWKGECSRSPPPGDSVPYRALFWTPRYKVTDASGDVWAAFPDTKLWQIQAPF